MINDAAAIVAYRVAVAAAVTGAFSLMVAAGRFVVVGTGGVLVGLAVGWLLAAVRRRIHDPEVENTISLLSGYAAYLPAEHFGVSGILAVVAMGIYLGRVGPRFVAADTRVQNAGMWDVVVFVLEGLIFILTGLALRPIVEGLTGAAALELARAAVLVSLAVVIARLLWVYFAGNFRWLLGTRLRPREPRPRWQVLTVVGWAGPARGPRVRAVDASGRTVAHPRSLSPPHAPLARPRGRRARDPDRGQIHRAPAARTRAARRRAAGAAPHARQRRDLRRRDATRSAGARLRRAPAPSRVNGHPSTSAAISSTCGGSAPAPIGGRRSCQASTSRTDSGARRASRSSRRSSSPAVMPIASRDTRPSRRARSLWRRSVAARRAAASTHGMSRRLRRSRWAPRQRASSSAATRLRRSGAARRIARSSAARSNGTGSATAACSSSRVARAGSARAPASVTTTPST